MIRIGYARVSTLDQNPATQTDALTAAECERVFTDHGVSGAKASSPRPIRSLLLRLWLPGPGTLPSSQPPAGSRSR